MRGQSLADILADETGNIRPEVADRLMEGGAPEQIPALRLPPPPPPAPLPAVPGPKDLLLLHLLDSAWVPFIGFILGVLVWVV